jgi:protein TonB
MMRSASFFILSVSLHAAALAYPASFGGRPQVELIPVTILRLEQGGGAGGQHGNRNLSAPRAVQSPRAKPLARQPRVEPKSFANPELEALPASNFATASDSSIALVSAIANATDTVAPTIYGPAGNNANGFGESLGGSGGGHGPGSSGAGSGRGSGSGVGSGSSGTGIALTQARYRDTPRPDYPESARREGREGRVLLRVLVDDQGRSKKVEISGTSGSEVLDRAAAEAIRRWLFHPARYGDKPVESWLRIPVEFRLADANSQ